MVAKFKNWASKHKPFTATMALAGFIHAGDYLSSFLCSHLHKGIEANLFVAGPNGEFVLSSALIVTLVYAVMQEVAFPFAGTLTNNELVESLFCVPALYELYRGSGIVAHNFLILWKG